MAILYTGWAQTPRGWAYYLVDNEGDAPSPPANLYLPCYALTQNSLRYWDTDLEEWVTAAAAGSSGGGGAHPDLATHDALGLATQAELDAHAGAADPHTDYVQEAAVPGGELGGTYASPTVDATHSGSTHAAAQAAAEATAQAALDAHTGDTVDAHDASAISILDAASDFTATDVEGALAELQADAEAHVAASDPHTGYRLESVAIAAADVAADVATQAELDAHAAAADPHTGYQKESEKAVANGYASLDSGGTVPDAQLPSTLARDSELPVAGTTPSTQAFSDVAAGGSAPTFSKNDHKHGMPANPSGWIMKSKAGDETRINNAVLSNDADLQFSMAANTKYRIRINIFWDTTAAGDYKFAITGPASPTLVRSARRQAVAGVLPAGVVEDVAYLGSTALVSATALGNTLYIEMIVHNGANAGTFAIQFAQNTQTNDTGVIHRAGSYLEYAVA